MIKINIKPLSVNEAWKGRRYKTSKYNKYTKNVMLLMPKATIPEGKLKVTIINAFSNHSADIDNPIKMILDIMQKKYKFNDNKIYELNIKKQIVPKGKEYFCFEIESIIV